MVCLNKISTVAQLKEAKENFAKDCLNETVLSGKKWQNSLKRFQKLNEKFDATIQERIEEEIRIAKMVLKCAQRLITEGVQED